jgi:TolA-binding protein
MKSAKRIYSISILMVLLVSMLALTAQSFAGAPEDRSSIKDVRQETQELIQALGDYTAEQRDQAVQKTQEALDKLDRRIDELETRIEENWEKMNKDVREKARSDLKALREQQTEVAQWYRRLKTGSTEAWEHIKRGFMDAYKSLGDAWEKSEKDFGSKK